MHTVVMPKMGDTMEEGKIITWHKHEGDQIAKGDALAEIETEKVNIEAEAFAAGILRKIIAPDGATVPVGQPIALIGAANEAIPAEFGGGSAAKAAPAAAPSPAATPAVQPMAANAPVNIASAPAPNGLNERVFISPIARRIAAEHQLDITGIHGTGPSGRIIRNDVEQALQAGPSVTVSAPAQPAIPTPTGPEVEAVALSQMRKTIARRLQQSMQTVPHFYVTVSVDVTDLIALRAEINTYADSQPQPIKVSLNDLIVRAAALTLETMPQVNVSFDGERILYKKRINIGVAVALDAGLIVPVITDADKRGTLDLARESRRLVEAARAGKLKAEELQGGTFTISNLGMYDVESFTAIINPPEAAILAVGSAVPTPVVRDGQVIVRDIMKLTLSSDHRVLDGAIAARFLQALKRLLEQPMGLLL
jgi:pyruvate dehydrogenase E2 component (dihydrolipoamide acetyltransferase)